MSMVSMKMSPEEASEQYGSSISSDAPEYPYGLCLNLDEEGIAKLGMPALPQVDQTMIITARVKVTSVSSRDTSGGDKEQSVSLQITDMEIGPDRETKTAEQTLYGSGA